MNSWCENSININMKKVHMDSYEGIQMKVTRFKMVIAIAVVVVSRFTNVVMQTRHIYNLNKAGETYKTFTLWP